MSPSVVLKGAYKFSMKKLVAGGEMGQSTFTGPGELLLGPPMLGDITSLRLTGKESWSVGHDGYLASTQNVVKDYKRQGIGKAMFSGEGLWVYKISGTGLLWLTSFGAIIRKDVSFFFEFFLFFLRGGGWGWMDLANVLCVCVVCSLSREKSISSIMDTWWRGTPSMFLRGWRPGGSSRGLRRLRGWCASLPGRGRFFSRRGMR